MAKILPSANGKKIMKGQKNSDFFHIKSGSFLHFVIHNGIFKQLLNGFTLIVIVLKSDKITIDIEKLLPSDGK